MRALSFKTHITQVIFAAALSCYCALAQAQLSNIPEFFEKHFQVEAKDAQDGAKLHSQFDYAIDDTLTTRSEVKMNKDGFEDHMAVGIVQNYGAAKTKVTYTLHRFNYSEREEQASDVTFDFYYRSLRLQRRVEETAQISTIGIPFDLFAVQLDLSFSQTLEKGSANNADVYRLKSRVNRLNLSASLKEIGDENCADFITEYRPSDSWVMKFSYTDNGTELQRQFRSEYVAREYRLAGEYRSLTAMGDQPRTISAIGIEKDTDQALLKLRIEYDAHNNSPALFFKVESDNLF